MQCTLKNPNYKLSTSVHWQRIISTEKSLKKTPNNKPTPKCCREFTEAYFELSRLENANPEVLTKPLKYSPISNMWAKSFCFIRMLPFFKLGTGLEVSLLGCTSSKLCSSCCLLFTGACNSCNSFSSSKMLLRARWTVFKSFSSKALKYNVIFLGRGIK